MIHAQGDVPGAIVGVVNSYIKKFQNLEERLRAMESHVTDSRFELQREFRKISGEN